MNLTVYLIEDDSRVRIPTKKILETHGYRIHAYESGLDFLANLDARNVNDSGDGGCLLVDIGMPSLNGIDLCARLRGVECRLPVVIMSGTSDIADAVKAMRIGAIDFLQKPFSESEVLKMVSKAIEQDRERRRTSKAKERIEAYLVSLTDREHQILSLVVGGWLSKNIARSLDISPKTVEVHRSNILKKSDADSMITLVRMLASHGFVIEEPGESRLVDLSEKTA